MGHGSGRAPFYLLIILSRALILITRLGLGPRSTYRPITRTVVAHATDTTELLGIKTYLFTGNKSCVKHCAALQDMHRTS